MSVNYVAPNFDLGLGRAKKGLDFHREDYVLGTLSTDCNIFAVASIGASVANSTVQGYFVLPARLKIPKIAVFCSAISTVAGTISFNIVLGTGAYTQGNVPGNDNSSQYGFCTNPAVAGQAMFAADVVFNVANFPNLTTGTGTGATYAQILVPSNPDAVWPNSGVLTLRATTPGGGSITNLIISVVDEPQPLSSSAPSPGQGGSYPEPQIDF